MYNSKNLTFDRKTNTLEGVLSEVTNNSGIIPVEVTISHAAVPYTFAKTEVIRTGGHFHYAEYFCPELGWKLKLFGPAF